MYGQREAAFELEKLPFEDHGYSFIRLKRVFGGVEVDCAESGDIVMVDSHKLDNHTKAPSGYLPVVGMFNIRPRFKDYPEAR